MAANLDITIEYGANFQHYQQLFAGIYRLHRWGFLRAHWRFGKLPGGFFKILIKDGPTIGFDTYDGAEFYDTWYSKCDSYFKRSLRLEDFNDRANVYPLGLNYLVHDDVTDWAHVMRALRAPMTVAERLRSLAIALAADRIVPINGLRQERVRNMSAALMPAASTSTPSVLFSARLWDPAAAPCLKTQNEREFINSTRIELVRRLRKEFGTRFLGGIAADDYSTRIAPDVVVPASFFRKQEYLTHVRNSEIAIATTGLHGSIGWKLGEYVAFARAIVTEPLQYVVPGPFDDGKNYLTFREPDQCVDAASRLMADFDLRRSMMVSNCEYYYNYVIPERLMLRAILVALRAGITV